MYSLYDWIVQGLVEGTWLGSLLQVLEQLEFRAFGAAVAAFGISLLFGRSTIAWLRRKKIGDSGLTDAKGLENAANSKRATPTMGGVLIVGSILAGTVLFADLSNFYVLLGVITVLWLAGLGGADDWLKLTAASRPGASRQGLHAWEKLVFQLGLGLLVAYFAYNHGDTPASPDIAHVLNIPFQKTYESAVGDVSPSLWYLPRGLYIVVGVLMITGVSNAVNITDGMDGLATGVSAAAALGLAVLATIAGKEEFAKFFLVPFIPGAQELAVVAGAMAGACLGFLWFNCSPAAVFMGDTGALALGGLVGYMAIVVRQEFLVLFMCGVALIEIGSVVLQVGYFKATKGKRIFKVAPYHHHLHLCGWTEGQVVVRFWIISVLLVILALGSIKLR